MESSSEEDEDFRVEESEVIEPVLPAHHRTHHEQPRTAEQDNREQNDDLGMRGRRSVGRERELW